jgi:hypothetical protein
MRSVPTISPKLLAPMMGTLRFAHPTATVQGRAIMLQAMT